MRMQRFGARVICCLDECMDSNAGVCSYVDTFSCRSRVCQGALGQIQVVQLTDNSE